MFNLNHLYYFYVVASEGSVSSASRKLRLSQPALSVQIKNFEQSVGQKLFTRSPRGLRRTAAGELVYRYATQIFGLTDELQELLRASAEGGQKDLRVGVAEGIERPFSVQLIRLLFDGCPPNHRPRIQLVAESHETLISRMRAGGVDAMLTDRSEDGFQCLGSYQMPVVAAKVSGRSATLSRLSALNEIGLVLPSSKFLLREETDSFLRARGLQAPVLLECDMLASVVRAVLDGVGMGFLPLPYLQEAFRLNNISISEPATPLWNHSLHLLASEKNPLLADLQSAFERWRQEMDGLPRAVKSA